MKFFVLSILFGILYAANASEVISVIGYLGTTLELKCEATSAVKWTFNDKKEALVNVASKYEILTVEKVSSTLKILLLKKDNEGKYECISGTENKEFEVKIYEPLDVTSVTQRGTTKENEDIKLICETSGTPKPESITWYYKNSLLFNSSRYEILQDTIKLIKLQPEDAGRYVCIANQQFGSEFNQKEKSIDLTVEYAPKARNASTKIESIGSTVQFKCESPSVPSSRFEWFRDKETSVIIHKNVKNYPDSSLLSVELASAESFGNYTCRANNTHGTEDYLFILEKVADSGSTNPQLSVSILFILLTGILVKYVF